MGATAKNSDRYQYDVRIVNIEKVALPWFLQMKSVSYITNDITVVASCSLQMSVYCENLKIRRLYVFFCYYEEECPSQVGLNAQDHLQAKASLLMHPGGAGSDDTLPPGFEGTQPSSHMQIKLSQIPVIRWTNPLKIVLNVTWQVVAGEESKEVEDQNQREMKVLEAIYPRPSSIPPNPSVSMDVEDCHCIDDQTASIPITGIEDEEAAVDGSSEVPPSSQPLSLPPGAPKGLNSLSNMQSPHVESDIAAASAASVALTNIMKSNEHGNMIDHELLNKILSNPEVIEKLVRDYGTTNNMQNAFNARSSPVAFSQLHIPVNQTETTTHSLGAFSASPSYPSPSGCRVGPVAPPAVGPISVGAHPAKDVNYYKSLIQQHGGETQESLPYMGNIQQPLGNQETTTHNSRSREPKPKIMKPCIYFNSPKGCRNGANCSYQHDAAFQPRTSGVPGIQSSKRTKLDSEISSWLLFLPLIENMKKMLLFFIFSKAELASIHLCGQIPETEQMFRQPCPVIIPDDDLSQPAPGVEVLIRVALIDAINEVAS
ncbi:zinc finger CCCH domain-containing protein 6 [Senna tora]|uniref:Zinc finger CCCH domain-containing protein 6 n=1 Tax=Senna tora TaxID=362788 RepID=A0A834WRM6_9FABA|nr:zinc finger CCCH domain-containing protein 6 [Senna tora]